MKDVVLTVTDRDNGKVLAEKKCDLTKGLNKVALDLTNPRLWWCYGLGKPEMYTFTTTVSYGDGKTLTQDERIGLRSVRIVTDPDRDGNIQFYFVLNGMHVFAKGTNYIPQNNFRPSVTKERYESTLRDATAAKMNMIRIWGGGCIGTGDKAIALKLCCNITIRDITIYRGGHFAIIATGCENGAIDNVN